MFSFTRFCLRVLADLNEIIRRMKRKVILTIAITPIFVLEDLTSLIIPDRIGQIWTTGQLNIGDANVASKQNLPGLC